MVAAPHSADDYARALRALLPRGAVWPDDPDTVQAQVLRPLGAALAAVETDALGLLVDAFPSTTVGLLTEWQETLGLPDPCAGPAPSLEQAQRQVVARFTGVGGQSVAFLIAYAQALGYTVTITQFEPAVIGAARIGDPMCGPPWAYAWSVNAPEVTISYATVGHSAIGDPLATWGNAVLECEFEAVRPVHTTLIFTYG